MAETILIVDDTPANVSVLLECLGAAGYRVQVAEDGEEAIEQVAHRVPDLILLDVMMPGIDGFETCRRLKARAETREVPVIFMTALTDTAEKVRGFQVGAVDYLTKPVQHEEALARVGTHLALRRAQRALADELATKAWFMRIAAHDLRNPLCLIQMAGELARRQATDTTRLPRLLDEIDGAALQMQRIIDTFLQLQPAGRALATGRTDVNVIAGAVVRQQGTAAAQKQIALEFAAAESLPPVAMDATRVYQAITNYVTNALKFTPPGGAVEVRTRLSVEGGAVRVEVTDSGPGVAEAERGGLFVEFARLSNRPTAGEETHGIGLSIVRRLIEERGGRVGATFPKAGGSCFWCEFPSQPPGARG